MGATSVKRVNVVRRVIIILSAGLWFIFSASLLVLSVKSTLSSDDTIFIEQSADYALHSEPECIKFPYVLENESIIIKAILPRNGVVALQLENSGRYGIDRARIILRRGNELLRFTATTIPPGSQKVVLEESGADFFTDLTYYCYGSRIMDLSLTE